MKDSYIYPVILEYEEEGISISFPDLPGCFSCAETDEEAYFMAKEAMGLHLKGLEADGEDIPVPSKLMDIKLLENQKAVLIQVDMIMLRKAVENMSVKKTLTIPKWLDRLAVRENVNFSQVLQESLKEYLQIKDVAIEQLNEEKTEYRRK